MRITKVIVFILFMIIAATFRDHSNNFGNVLSKPDQFQYLGYGRAFDIDAFDDKIAVATSSHVWLFDTQTYEVIKYFEGNISSVSTIEIAKNEFIIGGIDNGIILVWETDSTKLAGFLVGHTSSIFDLDYLERFNLLFSISHSEGLLIHDLSTARMLENNEFDGQQMTNFAIEENLELVATLTTNRKVEVRNIHNLDDEPLYELDLLSSAEATEIEFADGSYLIIGYANGDIQLWDWIENTSSTITIGQASIEKIATSNGLHLIGDRSGFIYSIDYEGNVLEVVRAHESPIIGIGVIDGDNYATIASTDRYLKTWNGSDNLRQVGPFTDVSQALAVNREYIFAGDGSNFNQWDIQSGEVVQTFQGHLSTVTFLAIAPNDDLIVSAGLDNTLRIWDIRSGYNTSIFVTSGFLSDAILVNWEEGWILFGDPFNSLISQLDLGTNQVIQTFDTRQGGTIALEFGETTDSFFSLSLDGSILRWDLDTGTSQPAIDSPINGLRRIILDRDTSTLIGGSTDNIYQWDYQSGVLLRSQSSRGCNVVALTIAKAGNILAGCVDGSTIEYSHSKWGNYHYMGTHVGHVFEIAELADGRIVSTGQDGMVRIQ